jgi:DNA-binding GntR family transcriptional regulator
MVMTREAATLTERVYAQIRSDILNGRHAPGEPLRLAALAKHFQVSAAVVREALIRLAERHLIVLAPNQGFRVAEISREDLIDITDMRIRLEGLALSLSIEHGDVDWEAQVVSTHHVLERTPFRPADGIGASDQWSIAHAAFHEALGAGCGSFRLQQMTHLLRDSSELYRQLSLPPGLEDSRDVEAEHRQLMELSVARQSEAAVAALRDHFQRTTDMLLEHVLTED